MGYTHWCGSMSYSSRSSCSAWPTATGEGLPSPETLEAVKGYTLLRTDRICWIELTTDGEEMWVEVERNR